MARKNILSPIMAARLSGSADPSDGAAPQTTPPPPSLQSSNPNVRRFRETFDDLQKRTVREIDTSRIRPSRLRDRFDVEADLDDLVESIRQSGQQLPVLLREIEASPEPVYEPVYGRRRIAACARIGIPVKAIVGDLADEDAILAQGLENAARLDTSFIERAVFIVSLLEAGYSPALIEKALNVDQSIVSRMRRVVDEIPEILIRAIGPAHGAGRRPWEDLRGFVTSQDAPPTAALLAAASPDLPSPDRLKAVLALQAAGGRTGTPPRDRDIVPGRIVARRSRRSVTLRVGDDELEGFIDHLEASLPGIHAQWLAQKDDP